MIDENSVELHILGKGSEKKKLQRKIRKSAKNRNIFLHDKVDHEEMPYWFNSCNVFCLPSLNEGTPNVILEALACRKPVVASAVGGIPDIVDRGSGILFPAGDIEALAAALSEAIKKNWNHDEIVCPAGSWEDNAEEIRDIFFEQF